MTYGNDPHSGMSYSTKDPLMTQFDDEEPSEMDVTDDGACFFLKNVFTLLR